MKEISEEQLLNSGIYTKFTDMENGEFRYRLIGKDNSAYIRTEARKDCWENSHYHKYCYEMYIVQRGIIFFCELRNQRLVVKKLQENDTIIVRPFVEHNIYVCECAIMHIVKFGQCKNKDWFTSEKLDFLTHHLTQIELEEKCNESAD